MKTKVKIFFALFPLLLVLVLAFRSNFSLTEMFTQFSSISNSSGDFKLGFLQNCILNLIGYFGLGGNISLILSWYYSYIIFVGLGFLLYDLFLWFGSFVKSFR